MMKAPMKM
jgi:hypothetical protein